MNQEISVARARAVLDARRVTLEVETGDDTLIFECVIPNVMDLLDAGLDPILADITATDEQKQEAIAKQEKEVSKDIRKFYPMAVKILEASMMSPRLYTGDGECPSDSVTPRDLGNLVFVMSNQLFTILSDEAGGVGKATARFRVDSDRENGAVSGADVRDESSGDTETPAG